MVIEILPPDAAALRQVVNRDLVDRLLRHQLLQSHRQRVLRLVGCRVRPSLHSCPSLVPSVIIPTAASEVKASDTTRRRAAPVGAARRRYKGEDEKEEQADFKSQINVCRRSSRTDRCYSRRSCRSCQSCRSCCPAWSAGCRCRCCPWSGAACRTSAAW